MLQLNNVSISGVKRPYMNDYQPLVSAIYPKKIAYQFGRAGILTFSFAMMKYNVYLDRQIKADENDEEIEDFDLEGLKKDSIVLFKDYSLRYLITSWILKLYEHITVTTLHIRMADRLVKDVGKSLLRKVERYGRYEACKRVFTTALWGNSLQYTASLTYDVVLDCINYVKCCYGLHQSQVQVKDAEVQDGQTGAAASPIGALSVPNPNTPAKPIKSLLELISKIAKRSVLTSVNLFAAAGGYAAGSYLHPKYGGSLISLLLECLAGVVAGTVLVV